MYARSRAESIVMVDHHVLADFLTLYLFWIHTSLWNGWKPFLSIVHVQCVLGCLPPSSVFIGSAVTAKKLHKRSIRIASPVIQNSLPQHLPSTSKGQFQCGLESHLYQQACSVSRRAEMNLFVCLIQSAT